MHRLIPGRTCLPVPTTTDPQPYKGHMALSNVTGRTSGHPTLPFRTVDPRNTTAPPYSGGGEFRKTLFSTVRLFGKVWVFLGHRVRVKAAYFRASGGHQGRFNWGLSARVTAAGLRFNWGLSARVAAAGLRFNWGLSARVTAAGLRVAPPNVAQHSQLSVYCTLTKPRPGP